MASGNFVGFGANRPDRGLWQNAPLWPNRSTVQGTAFRRPDHHPLCQQVHEFQIESKRFGDHDGGPRHHADAHNDPAMGPTLPARIREALESICPSGWWILEDGRDIYKG